MITEGTWPHFEPRLEIVPDEPQKHVYILTDQDVKDIVDLRNDKRYGSYESIFLYLDRRHKGTWV